MTDRRPTEDPTRTATPEPSKKDQVDIANDVQSGLGDASDERKNREKTVGHKATQFDGNPNPEPADKGVFGPTDDTPTVLPKKEGA